MRKLGGWSNKTRSVGEIEAAMKGNRGITEGKRNGNVKKRVSLQKRGWDCEKRANSRIFCYYSAFLAI